jgi:hypothetical protein
MPTLRWDRTSWQEFVAALEAYAAEISGKPNEDFAYLRCLGLLRGKSMEDRAVRASLIVEFLNNWNCRLKATETRMMLDPWIRKRADRLRGLRDVHILDDALPDLAGEMNALYGELMIAGRAAVHNWSDAAASKTLHQLMPELFVMWDKNIKSFAPDYGDFTLEMHRLGRRLVDEAPVERDDVEQYMQAHLGKPVRKTMAKYLDEYNWYVMVGAASASR